MIKLARSLLSTAALGAALILSTAATPACCCGPDLTGPPGTISGRVVYPGTGNPPFTVYVIDANQFWDFDRASYAALRLDPGTDEFTMTVVPRYYWIAAAAPDGSLGMLPAPGYVVVLAKSSHTGLEVRDWSDRGIYFDDVRHVLAVPDPLPLGTPLSPSANPGRATVSPWSPSP